MQASTKFSRPTTDKVRSRYLERLGITSSQSVESSVVSPSGASPASPMVHSPVRVKVPLKEKGDICGQGSSQRNKGRSVSFDDSVTVCPIPMRKEYSDRIRKELYCDRNEFMDQMNRNTIEFAAEGWDWRMVAEDEDMIVCGNGELVHPIHYIRQCNVQRQFFYVMSNMAKA